MLSLKIVPPRKKNNYIDASTFAGDLTNVKSELPNPPLDRSSLPWTVMNIEGPAIIGPRGQSHQIRERSKNLASEQHEWEGNHHIHV